MMNNYDKCGKNKSMIVVFAKNVNDKMNGKIFKTVVIWCCRLYKKILEACGARPRCLGSEENLFGVIV